MILFAVGRGPRLEPRWPRARKIPLLFLTTLSLAAVAPPFVSTAATSIQASPSSSAATAPAPDGQHGAHETPSLMAGPSLRWPEVRAEVLRRNPRLEALQLRVEAARARVSAAGTLPDPQVGAFAFEAPLDLSSLPVMIELRQTIPLFGRLKREAAMAGAMADVMEAEREVESRALVSMARKAYARYLRANASLEVLDQNVTLAKDLVQAAQRRYEVGQAPLMDALRAQEMQARLDNERIDVERERQMARAELNVLLDQPPETELPPPTPFQRIEALPSTADLQLDAVAARPAVKALEAQVTAAEARLALARSSYVPELMAQASYMLEPGHPDRWTAGAMISVPLFAGRRQRPEIAAATKERAAARSALEALRNETRGEVQAAWLRIETARRHVRLHEETLIPLATRTLEAARAAYHAGQADFAAVLEAAQMLRMHHLEREEFVLEFITALSELETLLGRSLEEVL